MGKTDTQVPDLVPGANKNPVRPQNANQYLDPSAFALPQAGFFGNLGETRRWSGVGDG